MALTTTGSGNMAVLTNATSSSAAFSLRGGHYGFFASATFGGGTVALSILSADGSTYITVKSLSAAGYGDLWLPTGTYQFTIATATAVYATITPIPQIVF